MESIGTATIKVLPDLSEFEAIVAQVPETGLTVTEDTTYERDESGQIVRQTTVRTITKAAV